MIKRVIAAVAALALATVGILLVLNYANRADERALDGLQTVDVLIATERILQGTPAVDVEQAVEVRQIPRAFVMQGATDSLASLGERVAAREILPDQQIADAMFVSPEGFRRQGSFELPEEAQALHQVTVNINNPQALGGSIAAGDRVGVFSTFEVEPPSGWTIDEDGGLVWDDQLADRGAVGQDDSGTSEEPESSDDTITYTDLLLDKVLVARVEGGILSAEDEGNEGAAPEVVNVTLALEPQDAARVIFAMETGSLWLTLAPESAEDADVRAVVPALPSRVAGVVE